MSQSASAPTNFQQLQEAIVNEFYRELEDYSDGWIVHKADHRDNAETKHHICFRDGANPDEEASLEYLVCVDFDGDDGLLELANKFLGKPVTKMIEDTDFK